MPQDFSGRSLRGHNFKGQDLSGANFSHADIRGSNFTAANLSGANFTGAKAGLQRRSIVLQLLFVLLISMLTGLLQGYFAVYLAIYFPKFWEPNYKWKYFTEGTAFTAIYLITIIATFYAIIRQGFTIKAFVTIALAFAGTFAVVVVFAGTFVVANVGIFAFAGAFTFAVAGTGTFAVANSGIFAITGAFVGAFAFAFTGKSTFAVVGAALLLGLYAARRANKDDEKFALVRIMGVGLGAIGGTSFYKADLTNANFTKATLKSTHLREANLTRVCWKDAEKLDRARVGDSILADAKVRSLLVTRNGYKKSFVNADLSGANLDGVDLKEADLKGANLHKASLRQADLRGANLTGVQAIETDFTGAAITGACLEAWNIDHTTTLEKIDCQFVFLLEKANERGDRERRPHDPNKLFQQGDFENLYREVINTVQILLKNGLNREAFAAAFTKLIEEHPGITPDSIKGYEKKGEDLLVTVEVPPETDKGKFEQQFDELYQAKFAAQTNAALLDAEKRYGEKMEGMAIAVVNNLGNLLSHLTINTTAMNNNPNISSGSGSFINTGEIADSMINLGQMSGTVTNAINQLPVSPEGDRLKDLLIELQAAIETDPQLPADDKATALDQVKELATAGQEPDAEKQRSIGKRATQMLKGIAATLPDATSLVEACTKLLPLIGGMIGL